MLKYRSSYTMFLLYRKQKIIEIRSRSSENGGVKVSRSRGGGHLKPTVKIDYELRLATHVQLVTLDF